MQFPPDGNNLKTVFRESQTNGGDHQE